MRPIRSFLLLLIFLACFTGLNYLIPAKHLFPSISEFVPSNIIRSLKSSGGVTDSISKVFVDSTSDESVVKPKSVSADSFQAPLPFAGKSAVHKDNHFISFLDSLRYSRGQVRIVYYGDSQIEGDRITSYLRHSLRQGRGGNGPGLFLPLMPVMYTKSIWLRSSSNWKRYNYLSYKNGDISHKDFGPFMTLCRYLPEGERAAEPEKAFVRIRPSNVADSASSYYENLRIFYKNTEGSVKIIVRGDGTVLLSDSLIRGNQYNEIKCPLHRSREVVVEFEGIVSPDVYGFSIESETGVIVDNIPQRGSAGLEFTMVGKENLRESYALLAPDLIILQYGLNIVKNVRGNYSYYQKGLFRQISLLKEIAPSTALLVIGVTDMAENDGDSIKSFGNIPDIIEAQKEAALKAHITFWDSYRAMGGKSSIIKWAEKKPPLAQKDLVHFTYPGADTLSEILSSSLFINNKTDTLQQLAGSESPRKIAVSPQPVINRIQTRKNAPGPGMAVINSLVEYDPQKPFVFTTAAFWIFFLIVLLGYSLVYRKLLKRNIYLFIISLFFYFKAGGLFLFILIFVTIIDYTCGLLIFNSKRTAGKRLFLILSIISNLGILGYFKYTDFLIGAINKVFGTDFIVYDLLSSISNTVLGTSFDISYIILPVGISFFTFQSLSYTIDIYRKKMVPVRNIIDFGFYVSFFPHLVAGPIVRASVFIPQIYQEFHLTKHEFSHAIFMISKGLIKKIVISNFLALNLVDRVFNAPGIYSGFENLLAVYGYGLQIYCDFSGYTDIAIGVALIIGFRLPVNFNYPYKAKSITDFWKRWHISLSQWLRDYLYISLGGNRNGKIRTYFNLMVTMLLGGLWHGASLRFIIWGGLHGAGLVLNRICDSLFNSRRRMPWIAHFTGIFITFHFVNFCWIFFRAPDIDSVKIMLNQIFYCFSPGTFLKVLPAYSNAILLMAVAYLIHFLPEKIKESYRGVFIKIPLVVQLFIIMLVAILLFQMRTTEVMPFIYFRF